MLALVLKSELIEINHYHTDIRSGIGQNVAPWSNGHGMAICFALAARPCRNVKATPLPVS